MDYKVEPTRVDRRSKRPALAAGVGIAGVLVVAIGLADRIPGRAAENASSPATTAESNVSRDPNATETVRSPDITRSSRRLPLFAAQDVTCHGVGRAGCLQMARAAVAALDPPRPLIGGIEVWPSLICGDTIDCPLSVLRRIDPLGSAVLHLDGSKIEVWVNVGQDTVSGSTASTAAAIEAWVIRWQY
jgi:hypothetical protein